jgi:hypothetical protein
MKFINFFLFLWAIFALLDPDPDCEYRIGSRESRESGSNPDPQQWTKRCGYERAWIRNTGQKYFNIYELDFVYNKICDLEFRIFEKYETWERFRICPRITDICFSNMCRSKPLSCWKSRKNTALTDYRFKNTVGVRKVQRTLKRLYISSQSSWTKFMSESLSSTRSRVVAENGTCNSTVFSFIIIIIYITRLREIMFMTKKWESHQ